MQGYGVMVDELTEQLAAEVAHPRLHSRADGGGLAAARARPPGPPSEVPARTHTSSWSSPAAAACLYLSAVAGEIQTVRGALDTVMAGLAVGEPSVPAWEILAVGADAFLTISDESGTGRRCER